MMLLRSFGPLRESANAVWLLPAALLALAAAIVGINTMVLPMAAPAVVWGIPRPEPVTFTVVRGGAGEQKWKSQVQREVQKYMEGLPVSNTTPADWQRELQRARRLSNSGPLSVTFPAPEPGRTETTAGRPSPNGPRLIVDPAPIFPTDASSGPLAVWPMEAAPLPNPRSASFVMPLGLHKGGVEGAGLYLLSLVSFAAISGLLAVLLPARLQVARDALLLGGPLRPVAVGVLAYLLAALLSLFLVMLVIGGPLASLLLGLMLLLAVAGLVTAALACGRFLVRRAGQTQPAPVLELTTGLLALYIAAVLPFLGWPLTLAASCAGLGSLIMTRFGSGEPWSLRSLE